MKTFGAEEKVYVPQVGQVFSPSGAASVLNSIASNYSTPIGPKTVYDNTFNSYTPVSRDQVASLNNGDYRMTPLESMGDPSRRNGAATRVINYNPPVQSQLMRNLMNTDYLDERNWQNLYGRR